MRIISFRHAAFYFRHAAHGVWSCGVFISSCGVWLRPSHLSPPPDSAVQCRAVLNAVQYVGGAVLSTCRVGCCVGCCSVRGQYRPNCAPNTESAVGSHVRPSRQSRDCLRGRPFRAPVLSVMVRSALGSVLPTVARARWRHFVASPLRAAPCGPFGVRFAQAT